MSHLKKRGHNAAKQQRFQTERSWTPPSQLKGIHTAPVAEMCEWALTTGVVTGRAPTRLPSALTPGFGDQIRMRSNHVENADVWSLCLDGALLRALSTAQQANGLEQVIPCLVPSLPPPPACQLSGAEAAARQQRTAQQTACPASSCFCSGLGPPSCPA